MNCKKCGYNKGKANHSCIAQLKKEIAELKVDIAIQKNINKKYRETIAELKSEIVSMDEADIISCDKTNAVIAELKATISNLKIALGSSIPFKLENSIPIEKLEVLIEVWERNIKQAEGGGVVFSLNGEFNEVMQNLIKEVKQ